ncbi:hypothetical protein HYP06_gp085 [Vibrio phage vB_VspP_pVa5]|uniref:Uncharacterized protein n=1 Tax=Vibrio phage vB_VspP_pVa5 TaxID=1913109 RepID=A0A1J0GV83_9CAUD|nr:hypothetical protein HYP06_gp085 [Vibrio phage vB_VspP_pVa5]APC46095.1 hypothetical protein vBVspPpVa5_0088 [Vibrio phage vB_VspP_pVa5]
MWQLRTNGDVYAVNTREDAYSWANSPVEAVEHVQNKRITFKDDPFGVEHARIKNLHEPKALMFEAETLEELLLLSVLEN